jgi:hypothetical protein
MGAAADCELIGSGILGQPVNALSTIALVGAGALILTFGPRLRWLGIAAVAAGIGSFLFHGPMPPGSDWAHDVTLAWLIVVVGGWATGVERLSRLPALVALGACFALWPEAADPVTVVLATVTVATILWRDRSRATLAPLLLLLAVAALGRLGSTTGPWCDPRSWLQLHAVWHIGAAAAVAWWGLGRAGTFGS